MKKPSDYTNPTADANFAYQKHTDESAPLAGDGTTAVADIINNLTYAMLRVLDEYGVTPSGATENSSGAVGTQDFLDALKAMLLSTDNPGQQYLHVREEQASGVAGGAFTSGSYTTRVLNTAKSNTLVGASLGANQITLPAGTYRIKASAPAYSTNEHKAKLYNVTGASNLIIGTSEDPDNDNQQSRSLVNGQFVLAGASAIELRHRATTTKSVDGLGRQVTYGDVEVYSEVEIWRVA